MGIDLDHLTTLHDTKIIRNVRNYISPAALTWMNYLFPLIDPYYRTAKYDVSLCIICPHFQTWGNVLNLWSAAYFGDRFFWNISFVLGLILFALDICKLPCLHMPKNHNRKCVALMLPKTSKWKTANLKRLSTLQRSTRNLEFYIFWTSSANFAHF